MRVSLFLLRLGRQDTLIKSFNYKLFSVFIISIEDKELEQFQVSKINFCQLVQARYHFNFSYSNTTSIVKITFLNVDAHHNVAVTRSCRRLER